MATNPFENFTAESWRGLLAARSAELCVSDIWYAVTPSSCSNPSCRCEDVTLAFREWSPPRRRAAHAFNVHVDLMGEAPAEADGLGATAVAIGRGAASVLSGPARATLRAGLREHRRRLRAIPATLAGYATAGEIVPYAHVLAGGQQSDIAYEDDLDEIEVDGVEWRVLDLICCNPGCDCSSVRLMFIAYDEHPTRRFDVTVPLDGSATRLSELTNVSEEDAEHVRAEWQTVTRFDLPSLTARYQAARATAAEGLRALPKASPRPIDRAPSVAVPPAGRREPCPCGSGKRYKNCCGAERR
jgi:hypothetical protein